MSRRLFCRHPRKDDQVTRLEHGLLNVERLPPYSGLLREVQTHKENVALIVVQYKFLC